ncbi:hypothetical protein CsSME_00024340 [Camellia sinensis var. sinensis]
MFLAPHNFLVDIKGPALAFLHVLSFEGGTRRNIPNWLNLYLAATGKVAEYGPLKDGFTFESSTGLARMLLSSPTCPVLEGLGKKLSFEIAVGLNGRVWPSQIINLPPYFLLFIFPFSLYLP